jgi:8-oxo-dGTP diphosphatase
MIHVTAAILIQDEKVFIARRRPGIKHAGKWEFPGGKIESGETPEQCLARELKEEFDITVEIGRFFTDTIYHYNRGPVKILSYYAKWLSGRLNLRDHDECNWVEAPSLLDYDLLPADVPIARKLMKNL